MNPLNALNRAVGWYNVKNAANPFKSGMITASALYGIGDYISQMLVDKEAGERKWYAPEWKRLLKMVIIGGTVYGPINCVVYLRLQPWYIGYFYPRFFPRIAKFYKDSLYKIALTSVVTDRLFIV